MSKNDGGPAFPRFTNNQDLAERPGPPQKGMTLRDYFAAKALQGMCADPATAGTPGKDIVAECYDLADAMLEARKA